MKLPELGSKDLWKSKFGSLAIEINNLEKEKCTYQSATTDLPQLVTNENLILIN